MSAGFHRLGSSVEGKNLGYSALTPPVLHSPMVAFSPPPVVTAGLAKIDPAEFEPGPATPALKLDRVTARGQGFTGNSCTNCGSMQMKVSGHCEVCSECGTTTGCS